MAHAFRIHYNVSIKDYDPISSNEYGSYQNVVPMALNPGSSTSWAFDRTVDNEVRFRIRLNFYLSPNHMLSVSGDMDIWEGSAGGKDHRNHATIGNTDIQAGTSWTSATILNNYSLSDHEGGWGKATIVVELDKKPPPPTYLFKPSLAFRLHKITIHPTYYLRKPKQIDLGLDYRFLGLANQFKASYPVSENSNEILINKDFGKSSITFDFLIKNLSGLLDIKITENYVWYMPVAYLTVHANPASAPRPADQQTSLDKVEKVNGPDIIKKIPFTIKLGYMYELYFEAIFSYNRSLAVHQQNKMNQMEAGITHYLKNYKTFMDNIEENININYEIENKQVKPKVKRGKPVIVTKEAKKGRNLVFQDDDGYTMNREEFVLAIKQGLYPGYHIRNIRGIETPASDPDNKVANNLG